MYMKKENVNDCYKDINLKNIFRNFLMKKKKKLFFFFAIFIFLIKVILKFF